MKTKVKREEGNYAFCIDDIYLILSWIEKHEKKPSSK